MWILDGSLSLWCFNLISLHFAVGQTEHLNMSTLGNCDGLFLCWIFDIYGPVINGWMNWVSVAALQSLMSSFWFRPSAALLHFLRLFNLPLVYWWALLGTCDPHWGRSFTFYIQTNSFWRKTFAQTASFKLTREIHLLFPICLSFLVSFLIPKDENVSLMSLTDQNICSFPSVHADDVRLFLFKEKWLTLIFFKQKAVCFFGSASVCFSLPLVTSELLVFVVLLLFSCDSCWCVGADERMTLTPETFITLYFLTFMMLFFCGVSFLFQST